MSYRYLSLEFASPKFVTTADVNDDGKPDIIITNYLSNKVGVLLNKGNGIFSREITYSTGRGPTFVTVVDINGDNKVDILVTNFDGLSISLLINSGDGMFSARRPIECPLQPFWVAAADLNGDHEIDLIVTGIHTNFFVLLNKGSERFDSDQSYPTGDFDHPGSITLTAADFNADNKIDVATANYNAMTVQVFLNTGDGTLGPPTSYYTGDKTYSVIAIDVNGDKKLDIIYSVGVLLNKGNGTFIGVRTRSFFNIPKGFPVVTGDVDNDGKPDIIVVERPEYGVHNIGVLINTSGSFSAPIIYPLGSVSEPLSAAADDLNGDGTTDIVVVSKGTNGVGVFFGYCK